ncbi:MAG: hypothetical protein Q7T70_05945 [Polaromonas sp.]|nr:hypothetical protein [Polaromonas sp.]
MNRVGANEKPVFWLGENPEILAFNACGTNNSEALSTDHDEPPLR